MEMIGRIYLFWYSHHAEIIIKMDVIIINFIFSMKDSSSAYL